MSDAQIVLSPRVPRDHRGLPRNTYCWRSADRSPSNAATIASSTRSIYTN